MLAYHISRLETGLYYPTMATLSHISPSKPRITGTTITLLHLSQQPKVTNYNPNLLVLTKRQFHFAFLSATLLLPTTFSIKAIADEDLDLEVYSDLTEGFTLLKPSSWIKVDKAGATALFEEANKGVNNIGVVVTPVRLTSLDEFGTPQFVADKLIAAEKRKESTKDAEVIAVSERLGKGGLHVYEFEYKLDSTRGGLKRIFSAAFVASKKLYLLNIAQSDKPESPLDTHRRQVLENVLHSFDATSLST